MPLSGDETARRRQLANLNRGATARSPAPAGNRRAVSHGGYAVVGIERLVERERAIFDALAADAPLRDADGGLPAADTVAVRLLAEVLCRLESVSEHLHRRGWETEAGDVRPAAAYADRLMGRALDLTDALGMTPRSRAKLGLDVARAGELDLATYYARTSEAEAIEQDDGDDG